MKTFISVAIGILLLAGCTKYENGPGFSLKSKKERLTNNWTVNEAISLSGDGGNFQMVYPDFQLNIGKDNKYTKFYRPEGPSHYYEWGTWQFSNDKETFTTICDNGTECEYKILRLEDNELWIRFTDQENEWELHLFPKSTI